MNKIVFKEAVFLKKGDLKVGHAYLFKRGCLAIYLGKEEKDDRFVFYDIAGVLYNYIDYQTITLAHYDLQAKNLFGLSEDLMGKKCDIDCLYFYKSIPQIYCEFPYVQYEKLISSWWMKNREIYKDLPLLVSSNKTKSTIWVGAKDLVPGELYYTGGCWRSTYLYLGRDSDGNFCWYFVGNVANLLNGNFWGEIERTKSNKKCRRLADAVNDPNAYVCSDTMNLIKLGFKADVSKIYLG